MSLTGDDVKKLALTVLGTCIIAVGSSLVTVKVTQAEQKVRIEQLERDVSEIKELREAISTLTTAVGKNNAAEIALIGALKEDIGELRTDLRDCCRH